MAAGAPAEGDLAGEGGLSGARSTAHLPENSLRPQIPRWCLDPGLQNGGTLKTSLERTPLPPVLVLKSLQGLTGTPLVAGSPIRHENAVQGSAVEVQTYQPPWKALGEFALQSDLDQPAFQQLVRPCPARATSGLRVG